MVQTVYCSHQCEFGQTLGKHDDCLHQISVPEKHGSKLILEGYKNCYSSHVQNLKGSPSLYASINLVFQMHNYYSNL